MTAFNRLERFGLSKTRNESAKAFRGFYETPGCFVDFIDFAKGCSITTIVLMHALMALGVSGLAGKAILLGGTGVHVFILLSGFGLGLSGTDAYFSQTGRNVPATPKNRSLSLFFRRCFLKILLLYKNRAMSPFFILSH